MSFSATQYDTVANLVWPKRDASANWFRAIVLAIAGSLLIAVSAKINIPFYPVPMTMQTFAILSIGMCFGLRLGFATILLYLVEGALGLPVFAGTPGKGIGITYMVGPTGGYLLGYLFAAGAMGMLAERGWDKRFFLTLAAMLIGATLIYAPGLLWLGILFGWDKPILEWGLTPFLFGDACKLLLAAVLLPTLGRVLRRQR